MGVEQNKTIATRIIQDFINKNNPAAADELLAHDFVNHSPQFGVTQDREGIMQMIALLHKAFPDIHLTIEDMVAENDKVVLRMRSTGTNTGEFLGIKPTNKSMDSCQISIIRIEDGKVKERWNITDQLEVMRQLGWM
ncbi:MAG TPA: ester cyclase [Deltaproteobacteria bacterium]|nr:ester cyclase [Deltaproteobacteria bacterium]